jgi:predicted transcriptional regulator
VDAATIGRIVRMHADGYTYRVIAERVGVTVEQVRQVVLTELRNGGL